jgi:hypothetical protein
MAYWKDSPPVHVLVGAYLTGGNSVSSKRSKQSQANGRNNSRNGSFDELTNEVSLAGGTIRNRLPEIYRSQNGG